MRNKTISNQLMRLLMSPLSLVMTLFLVFTVMGCEDEPLSVEKMSPKAITGFVFKSESNPSLKKDAVGSISEGNKTIHVSVPYDARIRELVPTITVSEGATVSPASGEKNDFRGGMSRPGVAPENVLYTVTGSDGTTAAFRVIVAVNPPPVPSKEASLSVMYNGKQILASSVGEDAVELVKVLPDDFELATDSMELSFVVSSGALLKEGDDTVKLQENQATKKVGFSASAMSKTFTVRSEDGTKTRTYTLSVVEKAEDSNRILAFSLLKSVNPTLTKDVSGTIDGNTVMVKVPAGTKLDDLVPSIEYAGESISPENEKGQDFTDEVEYKVKASDGTSSSYGVMVMADPYEGRNLSIKFEYKTEDKKGKQDSTEMSVANIGDRFLMVLPVEALESTSKQVELSLTVSQKATLKEGEMEIPLEKNSVAREFDFSASLTKTFTVTSEAGEEKEYDVELNVQNDSSNSILLFAFLGRENPTIYDENVVLMGDIDEEDTTIAVTFPKYTNLAYVVPTIIHNGASIDPTSGSEVDFRIVLKSDGTEDETKRVKYEVTPPGENGKTKKYTVIVSEEK